MYIVSHQESQFVQGCFGLTLFPFCQVKQIPFIICAEIGDIELDRFRGNTLCLFQVSQFPQERHLKIAGFIISGIANE